MRKISGVYKIENTVTGDFYIGSSKDVKIRLANHKCPSRWKSNPNIQLYKDMKKYGVDKFIFEILAEVEPEQLKAQEQQFIEMLKPTYNDKRAKGWDVERYKDYDKEYYKSEKHKEHQKEYKNQQCLYNGETMTLTALSTRFYRAGIPHPTLEAKKYILEESK